MDVPPQATMPFQRVGWKLYAGKALTTGECVDQSKENSFLDVEAVSAQQIQESGYHLEGDTHLFVHTCPRDVYPQHTDKSASFHTPMTRGGGKARYKTGAQERIIKHSKKITQLPTHKFPSTNSSSHFFCSQSSCQLFRRAANEKKRRRGIETLWRQSC